MIKLIKIDLKKVCNPGRNTLHSPIALLSPFFLTTTISYTSQPWLRESILPCVQMTVTLVLNMFAWFVT